MKPVNATLEKILDDTRREVEEDKKKQSLKRLRQLIRHAPKIISFAEAIGSGRAVIAEIKKKSPSQGAMLRSNVSNAESVYKTSKSIKAISVLTNRTHFGMHISALQKVKNFTGKPVLRKDFIFDPYQVWQARAYGADAILLMANVLEQNQLHSLADIANELGMDVLFETHNKREVDEVPTNAKIIGINCRHFDSHKLSPRQFWFSRFVRKIGLPVDQSINTNRFEYADEIPNHVIKVAESGVSPGNCSDIFGMGFDAVLVGTSFLMDPKGVKHAVDGFENAINRASAKHSRQGQMVPVAA